MLKSKLKYLMIGASTIGASLAMLASTSTPVAAQTTVAVAVTQSFLPALDSLSGQFDNYYLENGNLSYNVQENFGLSDQNIEANIIAGGTGYDLFISQDTRLLDELKRKYPNLVVGRPFPIAVDNLDLYSASVDISHGLPRDFYKQDVLIPDPKTDVFGKAAWEVLSHTPGFDLALRNKHILTAPGVTQAFYSIEFGTPAYGFVNKSAICQNYGSGDTYIPGTYQHQYRPFIDYRGEIVVSGIKLVNSARTAAQDTELDQLVDFLTGKGPSQLGVQTIKQFCYRLPSNCPWVLQQY